MMQIIERTVDLNKSWEKSGITPQEIRLRRGEHGLIKLRIHVTDNSVAYDLTGCSVRFCCQYKGGQFVRADMEIKEGAAELTVTEQFTAVSGRAAVSYLEITQDGNVIDSDTLPVYIMDDVDISSGEAAVYRSEIDEIEAEMQATRREMLAQKAEFDRQEQARQTAEDARDEAERKRQAAEDAREKKIAEVDEALTTAQQAIEDANAAVDGAAQAAVGATTAAASAQSAADAANSAAEDATSAARFADAATQTVTDRMADINEAEQAREDAESARDSKEDTRDRAEAQRKANEIERQRAEMQRRSNMTTVMQNETERQAAELIRESNEETRESNEAQRIEDHKKHNEQQEANNQAQTANDAAQAQNDLAQQKNNAQQKANDEAAYNHQFITLTDGQFDPDSRKPTIEEPLSGPVYRVPKANPTETDKYDEWYWTVTTDGAGEWEAWTATQIAEAAAISTDKIDRVVSGEEVSGDEVLKTTQLSYYDKARKTANDALYAKQSDMDDALSGKVTTSDFDDYKKAQSTKDGEQDKAIESAQVNAEKTAADALQKAVDAQQLKDGEQDKAIEAAQEAAEDAAKRIPPTVTTEVAGIVPPIPQDATEKQYAIHLDEEGNAAWIEVEAKAGGGAADPRELRATIAAATKMHDEAHTDVQEDPLLHSWQNTQEAIEALQQAIDAAKVVSDGFLSEYFLQTELDEANNALLQAIETFKSTGTEAVPNLTEFESLKARVKAVDDETAVSAEGKEITFGEKWVTPSERTTAAAAVNTATSSIQAATKQSQIDTACDTLETAVALYEGQVKTAAADNTGIDQALSDAEKAREGVVVSEDGSELEPGSRYVTEQQPLDDIASAIETATQAKSDATNQKMLDDATATLAQATKDFNAQVQQNLKIPQSSEELEAMSWEEIAQLSAAAAEDPTQFLFMTDGEHKLEKNVTMSGISTVTDVKARIIGVGQDVDESGNKIGITFQLCDGLSYNQPVAMQMNSSRTTSGGWETCLMRTTNLSKIEAALPDDLKSRLKTVKKKTNMTSSGSTLKETSDKLFMLSYTEVFGDDQAPNSSNTPWCKGEGEWYQWYKSHNNDSDRIIKDQSGSAYYWWLRSVYSSSTFGRVGSNGTWNGSGANNSYLPCAGFSV